MIRIPILPRILTYIHVFHSAVYRGHIARKKVLPQIKQRRKAAVKIQSRIRGHLVRQDVNRRKGKENQSAIMIQKGKLDKKKLDVIW